MAHRPRLRALADRLGILEEYVDITGKERRFTSDETRVALLAAMGFDADDEAAAARALADLDRREKARLLDPVRVAREGGWRARTTALHVGGRGVRRVEWSAELLEEGGETHRAEGRLALTPGRGTVEIPLPGPPGTGYHTLRVRAKTPEGESEAEQSLIVVPRTCVTAGEVLGGRRAFGLWTNLYAVRSRDNWGTGDLTDLGRIVEWAGEIGAAFVGLNPLHALRNRGADVSPYRPVSRLFRNPLYLDVTAIPELPDCRQAEDRMRSLAFRETLAGLQGARHVEYERVMAVKLPLLRALHRAFVERHRDRDTERGRRYAAFLEREGEALSDFATFLALEAHFRRTGRDGADWRAWPPAFRHPRSAEVRGFRLRYAEEVDFHRYVQFELDRQLAEAARRARDRGLPVGIYHDLAAGAAPDGSDAWAFQDLFPDGATLGAPPDNYSETGQDWALPPIDPRRLMENRYGYWIRLLRAAFAHAGALRVDHVIGLFRQFWVPRGRPPTEGAYVRSRPGDLLGILALESRRHGALVVGEDLGTVPPGVPAALARWGVLSCRLLCFERTRRGDFKPAARISGRALVTVNNHDLPPLAGYWRGEDLAVRRETGHIAGEDSLREAETHRLKWRRALLKRLRAEGVLPGNFDPDDAPALCAAVHAYLCRTRAPLVGLSLDDLAGETEAVNLPGVPQERFRGWSRRMRRVLEDLPDDPAARQALGPLKKRSFFAKVGSFSDR